MIENMVLKSKNTLTPDRKLWIFSGHDETVANMMNTLGVFEPHCPPYTATLLIELRINNKNDYFVTVCIKKKCFKLFIKIFSINFIVIFRFPIKIQVLNQRY